MDKRNTLSASLVSKNRRLTNRRTAKRVRLFTHSREFMGLPPSGKSLTVTGVHIHRLANGKIVEIWAHPDALGFMQQLGAIPALAQRGA